MTGKTSIILVNYNTSEMTRQCIRSIYAQVREPMEIIVVDNASRDNSVRDIAAEFEDVQVIEAGGNIGFGSANNLGVRTATGEYIFLLNSDTILRNDPLPYFIEALQENEQTGVVGAYLTDQDGKPSLSGGRTYSIQKYLSLGMRAYLHLVGSKHQHPSHPQVDYVIGADMFMRKSLFEATDGFDERIFMYFEDVELCDRITRSGYKNRLVKGPEIVHLEKAEGQNMFVKIHNMASLMYCMQKKYPRWQFRLFQLTFFLLKLPLMILKGEREYVMAAWHWERYMRNNNDIKHTER